MLVVASSRLIDQTSIPNRDVFIAPTIMTPKIVTDGSEVAIMARELKKKKKRLEPHREFIEVPLGKDPTKTVKLGPDHPEAVKENLIACLRENADLFALSASELPEIPLKVACHHLAVNPDTVCVVQKRRAQSEEKVEAAAKAVADLLVAGFFSVGCGDGSFVSEGSLFVDFGD